MGDMTFCGDPAFLNMIYFFKTAVNLLSIIAPIVLIIAVMLDVVKAVTAQGDEITKILGKCRKKLFAGAMVFLVPTIIFYVFTLVSSESKDVFCLEEANRENIAAIEALQAAERKALLNERNENIADAIKSGSGIVGYSAIYTNTSGDTVGGKIPTANNSTRAYINNVKVESAIPNGKCMSFYENCSCPSTKGFSGFKFTLSKTERNFTQVSGGDKRVNIKVKCSETFTINQTVNEKVKAKFEKAFRNICTLVTTGMNGIKLKESDINFNGIYSERMISGRKNCSLHAYGAAIDINISATYTVDGVKYSPYRSQGDAIQKTYDDFVKALGKEEDIRNVNYILWKYAFKDAGFDWGGTSGWRNNGFDPMHFQTRADK